MSRPVVAFLANSLQPGGTERLVVDTALAIRDEFDVRVWTLDEPGRWAERLSGRGIPVATLGRRPGIDLALALRFARATRSASASLVHAFQCTPWFYAALARLANPRPRLLLAEHGRFWPEPDKPVRRAVNRLVINRLTHAFVAVSEDVADRLTTWEGVPRDRIEVIRNGIPSLAPLPPERRRALRASFGFDDDHVVIGTVGRLDPIKNLPMLVDALGGACRVDPRVRGLIVGDGPMRADIARRVADAGLGDRIVACGHREDAQDLVRCMDVFVLSSFSEGISLALLEAMSAGTPVVVTAVGGNAEVVETGASGWVVPSSDVAAMAAALVEACANPELRRVRGCQAALRFGRSFEQGRMIDAYRATYRRLLGPTGAFAVADGGIERR